MPFKPDETVFAIPYGKGVVVACFNAQPIHARFDLSYDNSKNMEIVKVKFPFGNIQHYTQDGYEADAFAYENYFYVKSHCKVPSLYHENPINSIQQNTAIFAKGDDVWCPLYGDGKVANIHRNRFIEVNWNIPFIAEHCNVQFDLSGRICNMSVGYVTYTSKEVMLFHAAYKEQFMQLIQANKDYAETMKRDNQ